MSHNQQQQSIKQQQQSTQSNLNGQLKTVGPDPEVVLTDHKTGVNAVYSDGHVRWVLDPGILTDNELAKPFDSRDNGIMEDIWDVLDEAK